MVTFILSICICTYIMWICITVISAYWACELKIQYSSTDRRRCTHDNCHLWKTYTQTQPVIHCGFLWYWWVVVSSNCVSMSCSSICTYILYNIYESYYTAYVDLTSQISRFSVKRIWFSEKKYFVEFMHCTLDNNMFLFCLFFYYFLVTIICSISLLLHIRCVEISLNFVCAHRMSPGMNCRVCTDWNLYRNFPTIMSHAHTKTHTTSEYVV